MPQINCHDSQANRRSEALEVFPADLPNATMSIGLSQSQHLETVEYPPRWKGDIQEPDKEAKKEDEG